MADGADPLRILGLSPGASLEDAKEHYRRLCLRYHPDKNPGNETQFRRIAEAYAQVRAKPSLLESVAPERGGVVSYLSSGIKLSMRDIYLASEQTVSFQRLTKCGRCSGTGAADGAKGVCECCSGVGIIDSAVLSMMGRDNLCPVCKGSGIVGEVCPACHGDKTVLENVTATFRSTLHCYYKRGVLLKGFGNVRPDGSYEDLMVKLDIHKDPYVSVDGTSFKVYVYVTPAQRVSGHRGVLHIFDRDVPYKVDPWDSENIVYDGIRPGFRREIRVVYKEVVPEVTDETRELYRRIKDLEGKSCDKVGSLALTKLCEPNPTPNAGGPAKRGKSRARHRY